MQSSQPLINFKHEVIELGHTSLSKLLVVMRSYQSHGYTEKCPVWYTAGVHRVIMENKEKENFLYNPNWSRPTS